MIDINYSDSLHQIIYNNNPQLEVNSKKMSQVRSITFCGDNWAWDLAIVFIETLGRSYKKMDRLKETSLIEEVEPSFEGTSHELTLNGPWGGYIRPEIVNILFKILATS